jgi:hypothetical protein
LSIVYIRFVAREPFPHERAPMLEQLLARADAPSRVINWRAEAFRVIAPRQVMPPVATAALHASSGRELGAWVFVATPVHFVAGMSGVSMPPEGILDLAPAEAEALASDFNREFSDAGTHLRVGREGLLLCVFDVPLRVATRAPEEVLQQDLWSCLPRGDDAPHVRRLMSEIEMWLFDHAVNQQRRSRALPVISGLWLWGGGAADLSLPAVNGWTAGSDPLFAAFAAQSQYPAAVRAGVVVIAHWPGSAGWREAEQRWLAPAIADLRSARLERLDLSAGDRCFSVSRRGMRRFWRRSQPWWESFRAGAEL